MIKVTVIAQGTFAPHFLSHVEAVIQDSHGRKLSLDFSESDHVANILHENRDLLIGKHCCMGVVSLYCTDNEKSIEEFEQLFANKFDHHHNFITNNCADAVEFALDYFFKENITNTVNTVYKSLCCAFGLISCGAALATHTWLACVPCVFYACQPPCCPSPVGISSPDDVMRKARMLACVYGTRPEQNLDSLESLESLNTDFDKVISYKAL